jgi:hypothetical protein
MKKYIGLLFVFQLLLLNNSFGQIQISFQGNIVQSGSTNEFSVSAYNSYECFMIQFDNLSLIDKSYTVKRKKIVDPSSWTIIKTTWGLWTAPGNCYPGSQDFIWTTPNIALAQPSETIAYEECLEVSNDSCALYRYYFISLENGVEDSLDISICNVVDLKENTLIKTSVYPNPAYEIINIESSIEMESIQIISISGELQYSELTQSDTIKIPVNKFNEGMYILLIRTSQGVRRSRFEIIK